MEPLLGNLDTKLDKERKDLHRKTFVVTRAIKRALEDDVPFVCGRKGTGKTAVAERLLWDVTNFKAHISIEEDAYGDLHSTFVGALLSGPYTSAIDPDELARLFYHLWTYILDLAVFQGCLSAKPTSSRAQENLQCVKDFLSNLHAVRQSPVHVAFALIRRMLARYGNLPTALVDIAGKMSSLQEDEAYVQAEKAARDLCQETAILITIDTLEQYDLAEQRIYPFQGMCRAVKAFYERHKFAETVVKCFLPSEVSDYVFIENKAKYVDLGVDLEWTYAELIEFMGRRYAYFLQTQRSTKAKDLGATLQLAVEDLSVGGVTSNGPWRERVWSKFGPVRMRNSRGNYEDGATYLLRHTQRRPRECLCALNHIVEAALKSREFPMLDDAVISRALHSKGNLDIMLNSTLSIYSLPGFRGSVQALVTKMFANENRVFSAKRLRQIMTRAVAELGGPRAAVHEAIERLLIRSGLIGAVVETSKGQSADGPPKYYITEFEYGMPGAVSINEDSLCAMHPILGDFLGCYDKSDQPGIVFPRPEANWQD